MEDKNISLIYFGNRKFIENSKEKTLTEVDRNKDVPESSGSKEIHQWMSFGTVMEAYEKDGYAFIAKPQQKLPERGMTSDVEFFDEVGFLENKSQGGKWK